MCSVDRGGSDISAFLWDDRGGRPVAVNKLFCTYTWHWATVAAGQQDIPSDCDCWWLLLHVGVFLCVRPGGWGARPRGIAEHLLGSTSTNQTPDARWQRKIPSEQVKLLCPLLTPLWIIGLKKHTRHTGKVTSNPNQFWLHPDYTQRRHPFTWAARVWYVNWTEQRQVEGQDQVLLHKQPGYSRQPEKSRLHS